MRCLGIDIGTFSIKVAEVEVSSKTYALTAFNEYRLSPNPNQDRQLEMIEIMRNIASTIDPTNTKIVIAVPQHEVSVRLHTFPFRERQKILKSLAFELEDEIPLDPDETIFDAKVVENQGSTSKTLTVACPKETVQFVMERLKDGGMEADIVSVEGFALGNVFERWWETPHEISSAPANSEEFQADETRTEIQLTRHARVIVHMGHQRTLVLVYQGEVLLASRSINWGGAEIAEALARTFSIPYVEALKILQTKSFILMNSAGATKEQVALSNTIAGVVDQLARELRLVLLEVKTEHGLSYSQIDLMGGISQIQNIGPYLTLSVEIPANLYRHYQNYKQVKFEPSAQNEAISAVAIGLAIEAMKKPRNPPLNLRKGEFARKNQTLQRFWEQWRLPMQMAAAAFFLFFAYSFVREMMAAGMAERVDETMRTQAKQVAQLAPKDSGTTGVRKYIDSQKKIIKNNEILAGLDSYNSSLDILVRISERLSVARAGNTKVTLDVQKLVVDHEDVLIEGKVANAGEVPAIQKALIDIAKPKSVQKTTQTFQPVGAGAPFAFRFKVNRL